MLVLGHSQGGHAALFAGELATSYAPDLHVLGVVAEAPAADVEAYVSLLREVHGGQPIRRGGRRGLPRRVPAVRPRGAPDPRSARTGVDRRPAVRRRHRHVAVERPPRGWRTTRSSIPACSRRSCTPNSAGNRRSGVPLLVTQGTADEGAPQFLTDQFVKKACTPGRRHPRLPGLSGCGPWRCAPRSSQRRHRMVRRPRQRRAADQHVRIGARRALRTREEPHDRDR